MPNPISVEISAKTTDLAVKMALVRQEISQTTSEMGKLAKQFAATPTAALKSELTSAAQKSLDLKNQMAGLTAEMKSHSNATNEGSFASRIFSEALGGIGEMLPTIGLTLGAGEMLAFGNEAFKAASQVEHAAEVAGVGAEAIQAYRAAIVETGGAEDDADQLIRTLTRSIGTAIATVGPARQAFVQLGLGIDDLKGGTENVVPMVARGLLGIKDASERARLEFELFHRSGQEIEPALRVLANPTADLIEKMYALGQVLHPGLTTSTRETQSQLSESWKRIGNDVTPVMEAMKTGLSWFLDHADIPIRFYLNGGKEIEDFAERLKKSGSPGDDPDYAPGVDEPPPTKPKEKFSTPNLDAFNAQQQIAANLAGETARQRAIDSALITAATASLKDQGAAEGKIVTTVAQARDVLKSQADAVASTAAKGFDGSIKAQSAATAAAKRALEQQKQDAQQFEAEMDQMRKDDLAGTLQIEKLKVQTKEQFAQEDFQKEKITAQQKYDILVDAAQHEHDLDIKALNDDMNNSATTIVQANHDANQILITNEQLKEKLAALGRELTTDQQNELRKRVALEKQSAEEIFSVEDQLVGNLFQANQTLSQDLLQLGASLAQKEIANDLKAATTRILFSKEEIAADKALQSEGMLWHLFSQNQQTAQVVTGQIAQTGAVAAGVSARTAVLAGGAEAGKAAQAASDSGSIMNAAYVAAAHAYKSVMADVPAPANLVLAPIAAAGTFAAVAAFDVITSAAGGDYNVRGDGSIYALHNEEAVMPRSIANPMRAFFSDDRVRSAVNGGSGLSSSTATGGDMHAHYEDHRSYSGLSKADFRRAIEANPKAVVNALKTALQDRSITRKDLLGMA